MICSYSQLKLNRNNANNIQHDSVFLQQHACQSVGLHNQPDGSFNLKLEQKLNATDLRTAHYEPDNMGQ